MRPLLLLSLVALAPLRIAPASAQAPLPSAPGWGFEIVSTDRWLHSRQSPAFTRWSEPDIRHWLHVDSVFAGPSPGTRELRISRNFPSETTYLRLVHDAAGRVHSVVATYPLPARIEGQEYMDALMARFRGRAVDVDRRTGLGTFEIDAMELIPTFHPPRLEVGAEWTDSVRLDNVNREARFTLRGVRRSRIVADTLVDGRRHWIVRDSARVRLAESWQEIERSLDTVIVMRRQADGTIAGRYVYDPAAGLFHERADTMRLAGDVAIHYPDGRVFRVPAGYERLQRWRRYEPAAARTRREETLEAMNSERGGMLRLPRDPLESRLRDGDAALVDSLVGEWHRARDPGERSRLRGLIAQGASSTDDLDARLRELALEAGDTVFVLQQILRLPAPNRPLRVENLELLLPLLRDPAVALAYGFGPDGLYGGIAEGLLRAPPAILPHPSLWPCTPQACRLLAAQLEAPGDPRLRDLGLIARFVMDPARWEAAIRRREAEGSALVRPAAELLAGVGATWSAAARLPLPSAGAPWRDWLDWMGASSPDLPPPPPPPAGLPTRPLRFGQSHYTAIHFFEARTGRPVIEEIRERYATADSDSAQLVFGTILLGLGQRWSDPYELGHALATGSEADRTLALRELPLLFRSAPPAEDSVRAAVIDRILAIAIEGAEPWPELHPAADSARPRSARRISTDRPVLVLADSVPVPVGEQWAGRVELLSGDEWQARSPRSPAMLFVPGAVLRNGPFVRASINYESRAARREDQAPSGHAGGFMVYLMETPVGWVIVSESMWIT